MKKNKLLFSFITALLFAFMFPVTVSANSSWHWVSSKRPLDLLPIVIAVTLIIEIVSVNYIAKVKDLKRVVPVISLANLLSFCVPYIWLGIDPDNLYNIYTSRNGLFYTINFTVNARPTYTVSVFYLLITLLVETPICFLLLRKKAPNKKLLIAVIIAANIITTALTYAAEHIFCHGEW